jgi:prepilin signal peptidase PulO-like enzyme (type II secretory pathway)
VFFYGLIGAWFDLHGWKTVGRTNLREVFTLAGLGNFAALGTLGVTALAAVVTGQIQQIFQVLLKAVENQIKTGP